MRSERVKATCVNVVRGTRRDSLSDAEERMVLGVLTFLCTILLIACLAWAVYLLRVPYGAILQLMAVASMVSLCVSAIVLSCIA